uniref:Neuronal vesicle trafficking-associated protein 1-like n=1 Tax=Echeneis naucrates TaxID=173247 RepID=A0A665WXW0_ECHNA
MVKLGSNLSEKLEKQPSADDGFDNIPLITPLEVNQLQESFADKVSTKPIKCIFMRLPTHVCVYSTCLILITLAFLTSLLLLLMYKAMWYDQLTCPVGFILRQKHCTPAALEMYYTEQHTDTGLYAALSHLNQVKRPGSELPSPWLPVISALKEAEVLFLIMPPCYLTYLLISSSIGR